MRSSLNLLPWNCRRAQLIRLRLVQWSLPWLFAAAVLAGVGAVKWHHWETSLHERERLEEEYAPTERLRAEIKTLAKQLEEFELREAALAQLGNPRPALTLLGLVSRSARDCEGRLRVEQLSVNPRSGGSASKAGGDGSPAGLASATIKGIALDNLAVARFVAALRQTKAFDHVDLKAALEQTADGRRACSYQVECAY